MYSWGGDTSDWRGKRKYNYDKARNKELDKYSKESRANGPRTYSLNRVPNSELVIARKTISSDSQNPIIFGIDVTGSMCEWPGEFFDRAPLLYQTLSQYKPDVEISFGAIGDATCDSHPLQINTFGKELALESHIQAIGCEGGGGGHITESYELFAHFMNTHCSTPNARQPFLFIFGDERFYDKVDPAQAEHYIGGALQQPLDSKQVFRELAQKFNVYLLHKPYGQGQQSAIDDAVISCWTDAIGGQKIIEIPSKERAVDIAMALVARQWGRFDDFKNNLEARQGDKGTRQTVYEALEQQREDALKDTFDPSEIIFKKKYEEK